MAYETTDSARHPVLVSEDFRCMVVPRSERVLGCVGDRSVRRVWFEVPRFCDGTDMAGFDMQVHFVAADGTGDVCFVTDADAGEDVITFSWVPSRVAFEAEGYVRASVRMAGGGKVFRSGEGAFRVVASLHEDAHGAQLVDADEDIIVVTVSEED